MKCTYIIVYKISILPSIIGEGLYIICMIEILIRINYDMY